jgi:hypothetical protein
MSRWISALFVAVTGLSAPAAPVPAGKGGAIPDEAPVPAKAMLIVQLNGLERVQEKVETFLKGAFPKDAERFPKLAREWLAGALDGKELKGLTKDGRSYFVVHEFENLGESPFSFVIAVDDAAAFVTGFFPPGKVQSREKLAGGVEKIVSDGDEFFVVNQPGRVVVAGRDEIAAEYAKSLTTLKTAQLGDDVAKAFYTSDVSLYVNVPAINEAHGEQIKQFRGLMGLLMNQAGGAAGMDKRQIELVKVAYDGIFQMVEDGRAVVLAAELKPEGLAVKLLGRFTPDTPTGRVVATETPSKLSPLSDAPAGFSNYSASSFGPKIASLYAKFYREFAPGEDDDTATEPFARWAGLLSKATVTVSAADLGKAGVTVTAVPDAKATVVAMLAAVKSLKAGASFQNVKLKAPPVVTENAETAATRTYHRITLTVDYDETAKHLPEATRAAAVASMKKLLPESTNVWVAADGGGVVQVTAPKWDDAKAALAKFDAKVAKVATDPAATRTRAALPAEASFVGMYEVVSGLNFLREYLPALTTDVPGTEVAGELPKLNAVTGPAAYAGFALTLKGDTVVADLFVPVAAAGPIREAVQPFLSK